MDYIIKPFTRMEFLARIQARIQMSQQYEETSSGTRSTTLGDVDSGSQSESPPDGTLPWAV